MNNKRKISIISILIVIAIIGGIGKFGLSSQLRASEQLIELTHLKEPTNLVSIGITISDELNKKITRTETEKIVVTLPEDIYVDLDKNMEVNENNPSIVAIKQSDNKLEFELMSREFEDEAEKKLIIEYSLPVKKNHEVIVTLGSNPQDEYELSVEPEITLTDQENARNELLPKENLMTPEAQVNVGKQIRTGANINEDDALEGIVINDLETILDDKYSFMPMHFEGLTTAVNPETGEEIPTTNPSWWVGKKNFVLQNDGKYLIKYAGIYEGEYVDVLIEVVDYVAKSYVDSSNSWVTGRFEFAIGVDDYFTVAGRGSSGNTVMMTYTTYASGEYGTEGATPLVTSGVVPHQYITSMKGLVLAQNEITNLYATDPNRITSSVHREIQGLPTRKFRSNSTTSSPQRNMTQVYDNLESRLFGFELAKNTSRVVQRFDTKASFIRVAQPAPKLTGSQAEKNSKEQFYTIKQHTTLVPEDKTLGKFYWTLPLNDVFLDVDLAKIKIKDKDMEIPRTKIAVAMERDTENNRQIVITPTAGYLKDATSLESFYGNMFNITIPVELDPEKDYSAYQVVGSDVISVPAKVTNTVDEAFDPNVKESNEASADIYNESNVMVSHKDKKGRKILISPGDSGRFFTSYQVEKAPDQGAYQLETLEGEPLIGRFGVYDKEIIKVYEDNRFELITKAASKSDDDIKEARWGETITYTTQLKSHIADKETQLLDPDELYSSSKFETTYPSKYLEKAESVTMYAIDKKSGERIDLTGEQSVATSSFNVSLKEGMDVKWTEDIYLEFKAKVKLTAPVDDIIKITTENLSEFSGKGLSMDTDSEHEVKVGLSVLEVVQMPDVIDFGTEHQIGLTKKEILPKYLTGDNQIIIQDHRELGKGHGWTLKLKMDKDFSGSKTNTKLSNVLKYRKNGVDLPITTESQMVHTVVSSSRDKVNLTEEWEIKSEGLLLAIPSGGGTVADQYKTNLIWEISDTPDN